MAKRIFSEAMEAQGQEESLSSLVRAAIGSEMTSRLNVVQRATAAWFAANGDRERAHTTRVYLKNSSVASAAPIVCVMVDSHALVSDFSANRDLYLARLANQGFAVSGIEFLVDRDAKKSAKRTSSETKKEPARRALTEEEKKRVETLVEGLSEPLRSSVSKAVINSFLSD